MAWTSKEFISKRNTLRTRSNYFFWGGLLLLLLDFTTPFPTPVRGAFTLWWFLIIGYGGYLYYLANRLPTNEVLILALEKQGQLLETDIMAQLGVTQATALRTLSVLESRGKAKEIEKGNASVWIFPEGELRKISSKQKTKSVVLKCSNCGNHNSKQAKFCINCGKEL